MFQSSTTKKFKVTAVFCQTAIDSAQNDHAMMAQSILENKDWTLLSVLIPPLVRVFPNRNVKCDAVRKHIMRRSRPFSASFRRLNRPGHCGHGMRKSRCAKMLGFLAGFPNCLSCSAFLVLCLWGVQLQHNITNIKRSGKQRPLWFATPKQHTHSHDHEHDKRGTNYKCIPHSTTPQ